MGFIVKGEVLELSFANDHNLLHEGTWYRTVGKQLTRPHWQKVVAPLLGVNHPVTYTKGTIMSARVKVKVEPAGIVYTLSGTAKNQPCFNFTSATFVATGMPQELTLYAQAPLPQQAGEIKSNIIWEVATIGVHPPQKAALGTTGQHSVFVLLDTPIVRNSWGDSNALTVPRIQLVAGLAGGLSDRNDIASSVQTYVNARQSLSTGSPVTINYGTSERANELWSLLDAGTSARGHCGEATLLMEQMLRLLGIRAVQKHVYGRTNKDALDKGDNLRYYDEMATPAKMVGTGPQVRKCKVHGREELWLAFSGILNAGEGCVEVNGKLYAGLVNEVGEKKGGGSASHDLLRKLEQKNKPGFQVWGWSDQFGTGPGGQPGHITPCKKPAAESGGDPYPPVPS